MRFAPDAQVDGGKLVSAVERFGKDAVLRNTTPISLTLARHNAPEEEVLAYASEFLCMLSAEDAAS